MFALQWALKSIFRIVITATAANAYRHPGASSGTSKARRNAPALSPSMEVEDQSDLGDIQCSVFDVPKRYVKGRKTEGYLVCNSVTQAIVEEVSTAQRVRLRMTASGVKNFDMACHAVPANHDDEQHGFANARRHAGPHQR
jgi:hypothetical protein